MSRHDIKITWEGPLSIKEVISKYRNDNYDCGVYQVYGPHILYSLGRKKTNVILYIGETKQQTFSERFTQHKGDFFADDNLEELEIYLGRLEGKEDIIIAERVLIYKYLPSYNSKHIVDCPELKPYDKITILHEGQRSELHREDNVPEDFLKEIYLEDN